MMQLDKGVDVSFPSSQPRCRHCHFYQSQGTNGHCRKLNALMRGRWKACRLFTPVFELAQKSCSSK